jgi:hypothetical protein
VGEDPAHSGGWVGSGAHGRCLRQGDGMAVPALLTGNHRAKRPGQCFAPGYSATACPFRLFGRVVRILAPPAADDDLAGCIADRIPPPQTAGNSTRGLSRHGHDCRDGAELRRGAVAMDGRAGSGNSRQAWSTWLPVVGRCPGQPLGHEVMNLAEAALPPQYASRRIRRQPGRGAAVTNQSCRSW